LSTAAERSGRPARPEDAVIPGLEVSLWERMLSAENLGRAPWRARANGGAPGVDGMTTEELVPWLREHWAPVRQALDAGTYRPSPVRRVVIPKPGGGERLLGVPTCLDRLIQQAIAQVLTPIFDPQFSGSSFGFRPGRSAHQAVKVARRCIQDGLEWVADIDLDRFLNAWSYCSFVHCGGQNSPSWTAGGSIRRPFLRPVRTWTARSRPSLTRCMMVCRETP